MERQTSRGEVPSIAQASNMPSTAAMARTLKHTKLRGFMNVGSDPVRPDCPEKNLQETDDFLERISL
jgi:hypothetical protein